MCLMLYLGCREPLRERSGSDLRIERVEPQRRAVEQWFSKPSVQFVGAWTQCSCGFPSVMAETPIEYFEGMWDESEGRDRDVRSMQALIELLHEVVRPGESAELYPVWDGHEGDAPKGRVEWRLEEIVPETALFTEQFLYDVRRKAR